MRGVHTAAGSVGRSGAIGERLPTPTRTRRSSREKNLLGKLRVSILTLNIFLMWITTPGASDRKNSTAQNGDDRSASLCSSITSVIVKKNIKQNVNMAKWFINDASILLKRFEATK